MRASPELGEGVDPGGGTLLLPEDEVEPLEGPPRDAELEGIMERLQRTTKPTIIAACPHAGLRAPEAACHSAKWLRGDACGRAHNSNGNLPPADAPHDRRKVNPDGSLAPAGA